MKTSIWDALAIVLVLGILLIALIVGSIFLNPSAPFNPFPPATPAPALFIPTYTETVASLPPIGTPTDVSTLDANTDLKATSTQAPTRTPFVLPSPTPNPILLLPTNSRLPLDGRCEVVSQDPKDDSSIKTGTEFRTSWVLKNTGDSSWDKSSVDVKFKGGTRLQKASSDLIDLPASVPVDGTIDITITMIAPSTPGYYITYWNMVAGSKVLCTFYVEILAEN